MRCELARIDTDEITIDLFELLGGWQFNLGHRVVLVSVHFFDRDADKLFKKGHRTFAGHKRQVRLDTP
jgi:hypothetical protein